MRGAVIGVVTNYKQNDIAPWLNSLLATGYEGLIIVVAYDMDKDTIKWLQNKGVNVVTQTRDFEGNAFYKRGEHHPGGFNVVVERFKDVPKLLETVSVNNIVVTDVKDVIFQKDPAKVLREESYITNDKKLLFGSEGLTYSDEPWNAQNMLLAFGESSYAKVVNNHVYCAGVIAGKKQELIDIMTSVYYYCRGTQPFIPGGGGPDQAALNLLLASNTYRSVTELVSPLDGWVLHAGTTYQAAMAGKGMIGEVFSKDSSQYHTQIEKMLEYKPCITDDGVVVTKFGNPYVIVHQWDRVPEWKDQILRKYS